MEKIPAVEQYTPPHFARDGKIHVRLTEGFFQNLRRLTSWPLLALFFGLVWIQYDGQALLLFSFAERKLILFGAFFSWYDLPLLTGLMIAGACLLFFMAVAWGRIWCGFACPQSIWTWLFIRIEDITEGRAGMRSRLEGKPMGRGLLLRRVTKHLLWMLFAIFTALTFTGYFIPIRELISAGVSLEMSGTVTGWLAIMAGLTYVNAGLVREKICLHACPYSRFQAVMFDKDTRTVSYDVARGEPRAKRHHADKHSGDCVDCSLCVQVCPVGIDIRDGLQAACIDCAACIDACNNVMEKLDLPTGLIRFASEAQLEQKPSPLMRPRLAGYGTVMIAAFCAVLYGFYNTNDLQVAIRRDRGPLFTQLGEHHICNSYIIKVEGFNPAESIVRVSLYDEGQYELSGPAEINLAENNAAWLSYRVCSQDVRSAISTLTFHFQGNQIFTAKETTFLAKPI